MKTFTACCFIRKNSPKLVDMLKSMGRTIHLTTQVSSRYLCVQKDECYAFIPTAQTLSEENNKKWGFIDCGDNEDLFLALAALRDDSDYMQWYRMEGEDNTGKRFISFILSKEKELGDSNIAMGIYECRKATKEEIIEHFKK